MTAKHSLAPWRLVQDAYAGEDHYMVVDANDAPLFDSVNRSPAADKLTEQNDLVLAAAAPDLLQALQEIARYNDDTSAMVKAGIARAAIVKAIGAAT